MGTLHSEVDDMFLGQISDDSFLEITLTDRLTILNDLRRKAVTRFKACVSDLSDKVLGQGESAQFVDTLTDEEIFILSTIMKKHWLSDKIYNLNSLKQRMSTKDWKLTSQAEHLGRLTLLKKDLDTEISRMIVDYTVYAVSLPE